MSSEPAGDGGEVELDAEEIKPEIADRAPVATDAELDRQVKQTKVEQGRSDLGLRKRVANGALIVMLIQIVAADTAFYLYGHGNRWRIPVAAINGWLAATVIQVIGVVLVITRYLFPAGGPTS